MDLTPEPPFERGELLTAERVEAVMLAAAQSALTSSPDWTGGFRVPVSRWLTGLSETIEHGAAATDEHHGALALANLILRGPYRAGREDAARELGVTCQDELQEAFGSHGHECSRERDHRSGKHRCDCGVEWWATEGPVIGYLVKGRLGDDDIVLDPADVTIVRSPERPVCTCPDCDVTTFKELPGSRTVKGRDDRCPVHGPAISLGRSEQGDGDSPEEQRPSLQHQERSEERQRLCGTLVCNPGSPEPFWCSKAAGHSGPHRRAEEQR